ncbi:uncharacterized protein ASCRUDRAFT_140317 [Ascoidea rubescens DSM 1968]|uniref:XPG-I domain-containing protein n=1 Tax=Ascoidea rubescens DSM 1968 TaxID=1344418 RepID=A0A1D2VKB0_9ASCO|nr:hypothetical protein ASCRUDRAFT_140317 [Ascoidea rubescens DSM 1968]ODV62054.1 hypothetical protein ASCRUDRAFT_140317 [Ascoidea rubescens DSM 1968]
MGVPDLWDSISTGFDKRIPFNVFISDFLQSNKRPLRVAIDAYGWIFEVSSFANSHATNTSNNAPPLNNNLSHNIQRTLQLFNSRIRLLLSLSISFVFVFDGKFKPKFKRNFTATNKDSILQNNINPNYDAEYIDFIQRIFLNPDLVLNMSNISINDIKNNNNNTITINKHLSLFNNYVLAIKKELINWNIPYIDAAGEAEAECARLQYLNIVDYIITNDSDVLIFGGTKILRNFSKFIEDKPPNATKIKNKIKKIPSSSFSFSSSSSSAFDLNSDLGSVTIDGDKNANEENLTKFHEEPDFWVTPVHIDNVELKTGFNRWRLLFLALLRGADYSSGVHNIGSARALRLSLIGTNFFKFFNQKSTAKSKTTKSKSKIKPKPKPKLNFPINKSNISTNNDQNFISDYAIPDFSLLLKNLYFNSITAPKETREANLKKFKEDLLSCLKAFSTEIFGRKVNFEGINLIGFPPDNIILLYFYPYLNHSTLFNFVSGSTNFAEFHSVNSNSNSKKNNLTFDDSLTNLFKDYVLNNANELILKTFTGISNSYPNFLGDSIFKYDKTSCKWNQIPSKINSTLFQPKSQIFNDWFGLPKFNSILQKISGLPLSRAFGSNNPREWTCKHLDQCYAVKNLNKYYSSSREFNLKNKPPIAIDMVKEINYPRKKINKKSFGDLNISLKVVRITYDKMKFFNNLLINLKKSSVEPDLKCNEDNDVNGNNHIINRDNKSSLNSTTRKNDFVWVSLAIVEYYCSDIVDLFRLLEKEKQLKEMNTKKIKKYPVQKTTLETLGFLSPKKYSSIQIVDFNNNKDISFAKSKIQQKSFKKLRSKNSLETSNFITDFFKPMASLSKKQTNKKVTISLLSDEDTTISNDSMDCFGEIQIIEKLKKTEKKNKNEKYLKDIIDLDVIDKLVFPIESSPYKNLVSDPEDIDSPLKKPPSHPITNSYQSNRKLEFNLNESTSFIEINSSKNESLEETDDDSSSIEILYDETNKNKSKDSKELQTPLVQLTKKSSSYKYFETHEKNSFSDTDSSFEKEMILKSPMKKKTSILVDIPVLDYKTPSKLNYSTRPFENLEMTSLKSIEKFSEVKNKVGYDHETCITITGSKPTHIRKLNFYVGDEHDNEDIQITINKKTTTDVSEKNNYKKVAFLDSLLEHTLSIGSDTT